MGSPRVIHTEALIDAPPSHLWSILSDRATMAKANSTFALDAPKLRDGEKVKLMVAAGSRWLPVPVKLKNIREGAQISWIGGVPLLGSGTHSFILEPVGDNQTRLIHKEEFTGIGTALIWPFIRRGALDTYQQTTNELKDYAEATYTA